MQWENKSSGLAEALADSGLETLSVEHGFKRASSAQARRYTVNSKAASANCEYLIAHRKAASTNCEYLIALA